MVHGILVQGRGRYISPPPPGAGQVIVHPGQGQVIVSPGQGQVIVKKGGTGQVIVDD